MSDFVEMTCELGTTLRLAAGKRYRITLRRPVARLRLTGMFFDHDKCFLLPEAIPGMRQLKQLYDRFAGGELLLVGHTDTTGQEAHNRQLSLLRAEAIQAFLRDDVEAWYRHYDPGVEGSKPWGNREDVAMLEALEAPPSSDPVRQFQAAQGLVVDGIVGPQTRRALIAAYMAADETTLPADLPITCHGCGEHFPEVPTPDGTGHDENRRVDAFFFRHRIEPPPPGPTSSADAPEYPAWRAAVTEEHDFRGTHDARPGRVHLALFDALGAEPLAGRSYVLRSEALELTGTTDGDGRLLHEPLDPDDYRIEVEGIDDVIAALVLAPDDPEPQIRYLRSNPA